MDFTSADGEQRYADLVAHAESVIVGLDFDGTLAPIVDDPGSAHIHPEAPEVLTDLAEVVRAVAVVTGRPARQALALGGLDEVGDAIGGRGRELYLFGQYGNERWTSTNRRVITPRPPAGLATFERELPRVLRGADAAEAFVEDKGLAVAVHTRRLDDPDGAFERLVKPIGDLAERHGLTVEPGRQVLEVRSHGMHKGLVVEYLAEHLEAGGFLFAGDDLGDLEAFEAVLDLRSRGLSTLLVCSASREQSALRDLADVVVAGPDGVLDLLRQLTRDAA
ncbi:trehalose-phosphatase [Nocardioides agariphilus]|uniref:Trehalose 6-phosphate phosphatase n=1 Tax=Nocardioides agariphilus TaxID=433664 RepID=A0A930YNY8_9ACTN|nr:trehalose-phosphatase [Nocardioides agariphilus]